MSTVLRVCACVFIWVGKYRYNVRLNFSKYKATN